MTASVTVEPFPVLVEKVKKYLATLGVEVMVDFERDEIIVASITHPGFEVPLREAGLSLEPGATLYV